ncbi:MAG: SH3 domain-containing protein, partial [Myxococcota bacterium]
MIWWVACTGEPVPSVVPDPVAPPAPVVETAFVHASLLRLRVAPDPASAWTPLPIDSRVRVLERRPDWVRVISPDGRAGWVAAEFLGTAPLDPVEVQRRVDAATDPAEKVVWAERAAALAPGDAGKLSALIAAYRAAGRDEDAQKVDEALRLDESDRFDKWFPAYREAVAAVGTG